ncbi:MAG: lipid A-modifier LpxR family protein [Lentimonas sp.]
MFRKLFCLVSLVSLSALQAEEGQQPMKFLIQWDNDLLTGSNRDYTNGARIAMTQDLDTDESTHNFLQKSTVYFIRH